MEGKECECHAIYLIENMTRAYDHWSRWFERGDRERGDKQIAGAAKTIVSHLESEFEKSGLTEKQAPYYSQLVGMRTALNRFDSFEESGLNTMEVVRDTLHKSDELKQLMACGTPYKEKSSLTDTAKVLAEVFDTMSGKSKNPFEDARVLLDKQSKKLTCSSK